MRRQQQEVCWDCEGPDALCDKHAAQKRIAEYGRRASVEWASEIRPRKQVWMWTNRIPIGTPSALAGRGGTGKTSYVLHLIALLSRGLLPGEYQGTPRRSIIWSGEDAWDKVLVPRLIAAGADLSMVGRLKLDTLVDNESLEVTPKLPLDTATIAQAVTDSGAALVFIDPIASTMSGDLNREADVRSAVDALARVAEDTGAVMMFVRHFGKGGGNASDKMSGSHAFRDAVRSVFLFAEDEDGDRVVVSQDKGNYAPRGEESFAFRLESTTVDTEDGPTEVARVIDLGASDTSVGDIINRASEVGPQDDIAEWLTDLLANEPVKANEVYQAAHAAGHTVDQAKRAKKRLGILAERPVNPGPWFWKLPDRKAGSTEPAESTPDTPETCSLLPVRSEVVEQSAEGGREQSAGECSLPAPQPDLLSPPTPLTARLQELKTRRTIRVRGQEVPRCYVCGKAVVAGQGEAHLSCLSKQATA
ncbi:AAA family ATPase [Mycolicibacterium frederiksbergense]|uniref:AAA family ATPase n=1 Tax=Mycolicibacterium frederiksbergense TaxID=117567 RepID=UPI00265BE3BC|nr:AAA family ATPase [Mycolicibacterium frederiksbergense]MDO0973789.1 AAA family ATPase [Mycolicibacterium frederiksbergense]